MAWEAAVPKKHTIDVIEVLLDDDIDPADLEQGAESRDGDAIDWDAVEAAVADDSKEDDDE